MDAFRPPTPRPQGVLHDLGLTPTPTELIAAVKAGLDTRVFVDLARRLGVSEARWPRSPASRPPPSPAASARARSPRTRASTSSASPPCSSAPQVFEDEADAADWLRSANLALGGAPRSRSPTPNWAPARSTTSSAASSTASTAERRGHRPLRRVGRRRARRLAAGAPGLRRSRGRLLRRGRAPVRRPLERPGRPVVYASLHLSLAALETLAHADRRRFERDYVAFEVRVPHALILELRDEDLPDDWRARPVSAGARAVGDAWLSQRASVALSVPSVLVPQERNLLLDPAHPRFDEVRIGAPQRFRFDERL
jgi:RES domain-containing protein